MSQTIVLHLVSHASGELIEMLARNAIAQLEGVQVERRLWKMVRNLGQVPEILAAIGATPGYVVHSIAAEDVREALEEGCRQLKTPFTFALEPLVTHLADHYGAQVRFRSVASVAVDEDYYQRVEAMKYTIAHDDGVGSGDLDHADVVLVGVSRATKTPTCMYLASKGIKAANVPLVPGIELPSGLLNARRPLIVGLTIDPIRLATVRAARLRALKVDHDTDYSDMDTLREEIRAARRIYARRGWPVIDISNWSIEQTADVIVRMLRKRQADLQPKNA